ncbi:MAG TPA: SPOR domain-containing protein [Pyrinomonadaceae bacterium]|nr:SPOR domain-containing protein [Pyrinomonadaceae bacterium]
MKRCPKCNISYPDDTLNFCLEDGNPLVYLFDSPSEETVLRTSQGFHATAASQPKGVNPVFAYSLIGLLALLLGGGLVFLLKSESNTSSVGKNDNSQAVLKSLSTPNETNNNLKAQQDELERERQRLADERRKLDAKKAETSIQSNVTPVPSSGNWFVILGSYPKSKPDKADQRLRYVKTLGYEASIIDTNNYSGLRGGLFAVVLGPYSKVDAQRVLSSVKPSIRDAYAKSGG